MIYLTNSVEQTFEIAKIVASSLIGGETIVLNGQLGAGKTTFTKGLAKALGVHRTVTSPTFNILKTYQGRLTLNHFDLYRVDNVDEISELGFDEILTDNTAVNVIEWNKFVNLTNVITINITYNGGNNRIFEILE